jgi:hypothetical protein
MSYLVRFISYGMCVCEVGCVLGGVIVVEAGERVGAIDSGNGIRHDYRPPGRAGYYQQ